MVERSDEYERELERERATEMELSATRDGLEEYVAEHGYAVHVLGEEVSQQIDEAYDADIDGVPLPPQMDLIVETDDGELYRFWHPGVYVADEDASAEDILHDGAFAAAIDLTYGALVATDTGIEDDLVEWAEEEWEPAMELREMPDPEDADITVQRHPVVLLSPNEIDGPEYV